MALEIDGVRPALVNVNDVPLLDELRAFRHVFRHIYQSELDIEKLKLVDTRTPKVKAAHNRFIDNLQQLIGLIDDEGGLSQSTQRDAEKY